MTFDFAPDWMASLLEDTPFTAAICNGSAPLPSYPDNAEVAALVGELFAEGTLSPEQLCSLAGLPELQPHLNSSLAAWQAPRKGKAGLP